MTRQKDTYRTPGKGILNLLSLRIECPDKKEGYFCTRQNTPEKKWGIFVPDKIPRKKLGVFLYPTKYPEKNWGYFCTRQNTPLFYSIWTNFEKRQNTPIKNLPQKCGLSAIETRETSRGVFCHTIIYIYIYMKYWEIRGAQIRGLYIRGLQFCGFQIRGKSIWNYI